MEQLRLRFAQPADAAALLAVYRPYVEGTAVTFEYDVPSAAQFARRIERTLARYPYLAAERGGEIVGYAYAGPFHPRAAYAWAAEVSVYVAPHCRRAGAGRRLYTALEALLCELHILSANACIAFAPQPDEYLSNDSEAFHRAMGYRRAAHFHACGCKFGRWYDMIWMEKMLGEHTPRPAPVTAFADVRDALVEKYGY